MMLLLNFERLIMLVLLADMILATRLIQRNEKLDSLWPTRKNNRRNLRAVDSKGERGRSYKTSFGEYHRRAGNLRHTDTFRNHGQSSAAPKCVSQTSLIGKWVEIANDNLVDVNQDGDYSAGDIILIEDNPIKIENNPIIHGRTVGKCTALPDLSLSYCLVTYSIQDGHFATSGEFGDMMVVGGSTCHANLQARLAGYYEGDQTIDYEFALLRDDNHDRQDCQVRKGISFVEPWFQFSSPLRGPSGSMSSRGDQFFVDSSIMVGGKSGLVGTVLGECMVLKQEQEDAGETTNSNSYYCNMVFAFEEGRLTVSGLFDKMIITSSTGCLSGTTGTVTGFLLENGTTGMMYQITADSRTTNNNCSTGRLQGTLIEMGDDEEWDVNQDDTMGTGDFYLFHNHPISASASGTDVVGTASGVCIEMGSSSTTTYCTIVYDFSENGSVVTQGPFTEMSITGGTGCYANVKGVFFGRQVSKGRFEYGIETAN